MCERVCESLREVFPDSRGDEERRRLGRLTQKQVCRTAVSRALRKLRSLLRGTLTAQCSLLHSLCVVYREVIPPCKAERGPLCR